MFIKRLLVTRLGTDSQAHFFILQLFMMQSFDSRSLAYFCIHKIVTNAKITMDCFVVL